MTNFRKCNQLGRKTLRSKRVVKPQSESSLVGIQLWSFGGGQWCHMHIISISWSLSNSWSTFPNRKVIKKKVPLKSKISKHSTSSSKPLVKSTSLLWKHLLFIRPHAFFGAKNTCGRFCLQNQGRCSLELSWKATAKVRNKHIGCFAKWLFFSLFGVGKGPQYLK